MDKNNCCRINIILDKDLGIFILDILCYKYEPVYKGYKNQR
ncbi:MAG: hypothetical protein V8R02_10885 [Clostridium sp.]